VTSSADLPATAGEGRARTFYRPPWRIDLTVRPDVRSLVTDSEVARVVARALEAAGSPAPASIGLILSDDAELTALNRDHMGEMGATDVLSFPLLPPSAFPEHPGKSATTALDYFVLPPGSRTHLGDIVVSVERAAAQASDGRGGQTGDVHWSPADELRLLVTHGALHVCGWDHADAIERDAMRRLELELVRRGGADQPSATSSARPGRFANAADSSAS
jgi:probable rRNA maturation factor